MKNTASRAGFVGASLEEPRDEILESAYTFPPAGDLVVEGLTNAEEESFLAAIADQEGDASSTRAGPP